MIKHILKIAWNERRVNLLLVAEYFLIFCILWFVGEYMYTFIAKRVESTGMNIEHTYRVNMRRMDALDGKPAKYGKDDHYLFTTTLQDRLKRYAGVESVGFSIQAAPYTTDAKGWEYRDREDSVYFRLNEGNANLGYFEVFKIPITGNISDWDEQAEDTKAIVVSSEEGTIGQRPAGDVRVLLRRDRENNPKGIFEVKGYSPPIKFIDMYPYVNFFWRPMYNRDVILNMAEISIRVRPEADKNFVEKFTRDMGEQLKIGEYYMASIVSYKDIKRSYYSMMGIAEKINTRLSIMGFLLLNIFLGILGSFWFRTQTRRSEIGLRMAVGASKAKAKLMMILEAMVLLALAGLLATFVCYYLQQTVLPQLIGSETAGRVSYIRDASAPGGYRVEKLGLMAQDFINFGIAFGLLALITFVAVWYPAKQAADTQPAETLHEE